MAFKPEPQAKPPAAKRTPNTSRTATKPKGNAEDRIAVRTEGVAGFFGIIASACALTGNLPDAGAAMEHGPKIGHEAAVLSETNDGVARIIDYVCAAGPYAGLITSVAPFVLQIMVNHGRLPAAPFADIGVKEPAAIVAGLQAKAMRAEADSMRARADAEQELREAAAEYAAAQAATEHAAA